MFQKVLIANRGEIAVRIARALREMGVASVAVFSEADRASLHVRMADEACPIGPPSPAESYLHIGRLLEAARRAGAEAVHPGYGFLAENAEFAEACRAAGLVFIGPPPAAIRAMGDKLAARRTAERAGVPVLPGHPAPLGGPEEALEAARRAGFPVLLKAALGGGGKGMRMVRREEEMPSAFRAAASEAQGAFGDPTVYLEKYLEEPRHVEVQVMGDLHGSLIHLAERECSVQRRYQKLIEESPSPAVDAPLRAEMGDAALRVAREVGYASAGTVEFLVDGARRFYFLEMNTRLQVEHPVTELVAGVDLVKAMVRVAAGEPLGLSQEEVQLRGHAIEGRVYAEDPERDFLPSPGLIAHLREPSGPGVRVDSGAYAGWRVPVHYDPLISKLTVWGGDREEALRRMERALSEYVLTGIPTTLPLLRAVIASEPFRGGKLSTHLLESLFPGGFRAAEHLPLPEGSPPAEDLAALAAALLRRREEKRGEAAPPGPAGNPWVLYARRKGVERL